MTGFDVGKQTEKAAMKRAVDAIRGHVDVLSNIEALETIVRAVDGTLSDERLEDDDLSWAEDIERPE